MSARGTSISCRRIQQVTLLLAVLSFVSSSLAQSPFAQFSDQEVCTYLIEETESLRSRLERVYRQDADSAELLPSELAIIFGSADFIELLKSDISERASGHEIGEVCPEFEEAYVQAPTSSPPNAEEYPEGWVLLELEERTYLFHLSGEG